MYKKIDFTQLAGLPLYQDSLEILQEAYENALQGIGAHLSINAPLVIVAGVADLGANWGDGWVVINNEILPFTGGVKAAKIIIVETDASETFGDGSVKNVLITRHATLGIAGGNDFTDFVRLDGALSKSFIDTIISEIAELLGAPPKVNLDGTSTMTGPLVINGHGVKTDNIEVRDKEVAIGTWNMSTTINKSVAHGIADFTKIMEVTVKIINDAGTSEYSLDGNVAAAYRDAANVNLLLSLASLFSMGGYTNVAGGYNRGFLYIKYKV